MPFIKGKNDYMKEELVTLETAKLLKEKGFVWECERTISCDKIIRRWNHPQYISCCTEIDGELVEFLCPTLYVAQKWLRETKNLHVLSTPKVVESYNKIGEVVKTEVEFYYWDIYVVGSNKHKHIIQNCFTNQFNTYEEALEAGIQEALKLI